MEAIPVTRAERISLIDVLRGFALLGILLMNMPYYSGPYQWADNPIVADPMRQVHQLLPAGGLSACFFEGTMRGMFSMLFGAGSFLLISRLAAKSEGLLAADIYYRRLIWLIVFGLIDAYVILWVGDILFAYGVTGLLLFPFRNLKPGRLLAFGLVFVAISSIYTTLEFRESGNLRREGTEIARLEKEHTKITHAQMGTLHEWHEFQQKHEMAAIRKAADTLAIKTSTGSYWAIQREMAETAVFFQTKKLFAGWLWESLGFFLIGLALFKWEMLTGKRSTRFYLLTALVGYGIGLPIRWYVLHFAWAHQFDPSYLVEIIPVNPYQVARLALTIGQIALLVLAYKTGLLRWLFTVLARVGQMAFTNYLGQSLICTFLYFGYGFGYFGRLERYQTLEVAAAIWVLQMAFSSVWLRYFLFGPFEWAWRSLTYWRAQPMRRAQGPVAS